MIVVIWEQTMILWNFKRTSDRATLIFSSFPLFLIAVAGSKIRIFCLSSVTFGRIFNSFGVSLCFSIFYEDNGFLKLKNKAIHSGFGRFGLLEYPAKLLFFFPGTLFFLFLGIKADRGIIPFQDKKKIGNLKEEDVISWWLAIDLIRSYPVDFVIGL